MGRRRRPALEPAGLLRGRARAALGAPRARDGLVRHRAAPARRAGDRARAEAALDRGGRPPVRRTRPAVARHLRAVPRVGPRRPRARPSGSTTTRTGASSSAPRWRWPSPTSTCSPGLAARARDAVHLAVEAEPPDRVPPSYANIALLRAWLDAWAGRADDGYAARDRRRVPAPRLLQRVRLAHLLRDRSAGARALAATAMPLTRCDATARGGGGPVERHRPLVACRAREPVRSVLAGPTAWTSAPT